eukprot:16247-Heterococcus_DN1.PRE.1
MHTSQQQHVLHSQRAWSAQHCTCYHFWTAAATIALQAVHVLIHSGTSAAVEHLQLLWCVQLAKCIALQVTRVHSASWCWTYTYNSDQQLWHRHASVKRIAATADC